MVPPAVNIISVYRLLSYQNLAMLCPVTNTDQYLWKLMVPSEYQSVYIHKSNLIPLEAHGSSEYWPPSKSVPITRTLL